jgi:hypothetical protein
MTAKKRPIRTCVACRSSDEKKELLRLVRTAAGEVAIDPTGKKPGRGAYVCRSAECIAVAVKKKRFERALRTVVPAKLIEELLKTVQENENADR